MERLLLLSLRILQCANAINRENAAAQKRILTLSTRRDALLTSAEALPQTAAEWARWELVRYLNKISRAKMAAIL